MTAVTKLTPSNYVDICPYYFIIIGHHFFFEGVSLVTAVILTPGACGREGQSAGSGTISARSPGSGGSGGSAGSAGVGKVGVSFEAVFNNSPGRPP